MSETLFDIYSETANLKSHSCETFVNAVKSYAGDYLMSEYAHIISTSKFYNEMDKFEKYLDKIAMELYVHSGNYNNQELVIRMMVISYMNKYE